VNAAAGAGAPPVRRYHFHFPGVLYVAVTLFLAVGAVNSQNNLLFVALGLAIGGLMVSGILSGASLLGLRIERDPIARAAVGAPLRISYTITNANRLFPAFGLNLMELGGSGPRAWQRFMPQPRAFAAQIGPRRSIRVETTVTPTRRGAAEFLHLQVWTTFPFGLTRKSVTFEIPTTVLIRPVELPLRPDVVNDLVAQAPVGLGAERAPGPGEEFFGLRDYVPGDSPRWVAWRRSARTGQLIVRQQAAPSPLRLWVVLALERDFESGEPGGERAIALAAALVRAAAADGVAVGLVTHGSRHAPASGARHAERVVLDLVLLDSASVRTPIGGGLGRSGACIVVSAGGGLMPGLPRHARDLAAASLEPFLLRGERTTRALEFLGPAPVSASAPRPPAAVPSPARGAT
jgi:uncharacterized protein (DUF58 family)